MISFFFIWLYNFSKATYYEEFHSILDNTKARWTMGKSNLVFSTTVKNENCTSLYGKINTERCPVLLSQQLTELSGLAK